jgi:hypothetical protein
VEEERQEEYFLPDKRFECTERQKGSRGAYDNRRFLRDQDGSLICPEGKPNVRKYGLYSERYKTLAACSSTSTFFSDTGGRAMYCERASRALEEAAAIFTDRSMNPECLHSSMFLPSRSLMSLRFRKKATMVLRKK